MNHAGRLEHVLFCCATCSFRVWQRNKLQVGASRWHNLYSLTDITTLQLRTYLARWYAATQATTALRMFLSGSQFKWRRGSPRLNGIWTELVQGVWFVSSAVLLCGSSPVPYEYSFHPQQQAAVQFPPCCKSLVEWHLYYFVFLLSFSSSVANVTLVWKQIQTPATRGARPHRSGCYGVSSRLVFLAYCWGLYFFIDNKQGTSTCAAHVLAAVPCSCRWETSTASSTFCLKPPLKFNSRKLPTGSLIKTLIFYHPCVVALSGTRCCYTLSRAGDTGALPTMFCPAKGFKIVLWNESNTSNGASCHSAVFDI